MRKAAGHQCGRTCHNKGKGSNVRRLLVLLPPPLPRSPRRARVRRLSTAPTLVRRVTIVRGGIVCGRSAHPADLGVRPIHNMRCLTSVPTLLLPCR